MKAVNDYGVTLSKLFRELRQGRQYRFLKDLEYQIYSQFGDDGIIEYLVQFVPESNSTFIEFGVENYLESNTRLLLERDNWRGLVIDSSKEYVNQIESSRDFWRYDLTACQSFITRDNINSIFKNNGFIGNIGLLSIDIDGNDYWLWEAIDVVQPTIVVCEYNAVFGYSKPVSIPYVESFERTKAHHSNLYAGCSLNALCYLASNKGMRFLGCNSAGNNAYFVRHDAGIPIKSPSPEDGFVMSKFREARDENGKLLLRLASDCVAQIGDMELINVVDQSLVSVSEVVAS